MEKPLLIKDRVVVLDHALASRTFNKGRFGAFEDGKLILSLEEAMYLKEKRGLEIYDRNGKAVTLKGFLRHCEKLQKRFWARYSVFKDLRAAGHIVKTAFKYGGDFRVYGKGSHPGEGHAPWILYAATEHEGINFLKFAAINRIAHSVKKKVLFGVVDDEGSVTYYEMGWVRI